MSSTLDTSVLEQFKWERQPGAQQFVNQQVDALLARIPAAAAFAKRLHAEASVRFVDMVDTILLRSSNVDRKDLASRGWTAESSYRGWTLLDNELGMFPTIALADKLPAGAVSIHMKVEYVADFLLTHNLTRDITGEPYARYRFAELWCNGDFSLAAVERHGHQGFWTENRPKPGDVLDVLESFRLRPRFVDDDRTGFDEALRRIDAGIAKIGRGYTCDLWFSAEREYWMKRNLAARVQKARQDKLGIGWANHDHHTYRSSRESFPQLVAVWEKLGFHCRERFYAGMEAGWGAQVMEDPVTRIITFNDVDMSPEELMGDFSHEGFKEKRNKLGTVGLWCGLHGEAFLQAGMHHLEAQFDFHTLTSQLEKDHGIKTMKPFTNFEYLTQAFTEGERWPVAEGRIAKLLNAGMITPEQAQQFRERGAIGSHLENLERNEGFKGFNQQGVSEIIAATDPRKLVKNLAAAH
ncbi:MAG: hypothetical protein QM770_17820 [Tepidisphaeraceae bacterium]